MIRALPFPAVGYAAPPATVSTTPRRAAAVRRGTERVSGGARSLLSQPQPPGAALPWLVDAQRRRESVERSMLAAHTASTVSAMMGSSVALFARLGAWQRVAISPLVDRMRGARG